MTSIRIPRSLRLPQVAVPLAAALLATGPVQANEADAVDPIIVNGDKPSFNPFADAYAPYKIDRSGNDKLTEPLLDTPRTVTVIPAAVIQDLGATSFREVVRTQPVITLGTGEGGNAFGDRIFIRGFDARNDVYIDGLRDPGVTSREVFDVQQIEIIKGPSSSFGGRGTTGGAVNFITKAPQKNNFVVGELALGTDSTKRVTADVNHVLTDTIQVRVNGMFQDGNVAGRDHVWNRRWGVAGALAWQLAPTVDVNLDYYHLETKGLPDWGIPFDVRTQQPFHRRQGNFYGVLARDFSETNVDIATARFGWRASDHITLSSKFRYGSNRNSYIASAPESPNLTNPDPFQWTVRANPKNRNAVSESYVNATDAHLTFDTGGISHNIVTGFELSRETTNNQPFAFASSETVGAIIVPTLVINQNLFHPDANVAWPLFRALSGASADTKVISKAAYLLDTIDLTDRLQLSGGLRYDDYRLTFTSRTAAGVVANLANNSHFLNWNAGLVYKPVLAGTLYVSASSSSNPSGEQTDGSGVSYGGIAVATANLDPERNHSYEAGVKWQVANNHLLLTGALFRTDKVNARVNDPLTAGVQILAGKQRVQGVEVGLSGNITPAWAVYGGYVYLDAKVTDSPDPAQIGGRFPNIPQHSGSLLSTYQITDDLTVGGTVTYTGTIYGGSTVAGTANAPAHTRFDLTGRYTFGQRAELQLNVLNLTNKVYYDAIYRSGTPFAYQAPGRSALLTLRVKL